jgi:hypothetical protein
VQQLESHAKRLFPRSVLGCKNVLLAEAPDTKQNAKVSNSGQTGYAATLNNQDSRAVRLR